MLTADGRVKVLDFGLAALQRTGAPGADATRTALTSGQVIGTLPYMSPEQASGQPTDERTDLFSLGAMLFELASGRRPFQSDSSAGLLAAILRDPPPPLENLRPDLPADLSRILGRCLEKEPRWRYASARELKADLEQLAAKPTIAAGQSIAVLPFVDMSPAHDQEYFCDGVAEELINALTHVKDLRVVARTSAFAFKGKNVDVREIGRALNVGAVLEGSIRTAGSRIRVTAQLVNVSDGYHLWSERFDREVTDIFAVQDEIATSIAEKLSSRLLDQERAALHRRTTEDLEAYRLYLRGLYLVARPTPPNMGAALEAFQAAINRDPSFALAYVGIARVYAVQANLGLSAPVVGWEKSKAAVERALALDPDLEEAHTLRGLTAFYYDWDFGLAERCFQKAFALNRGHAFAHVHTGGSASGAGSSTRRWRRPGVRSILDPLSPHIFGMAVGLHTYSGQLEGADEMVQRALELDPNSALAYAHLGKCRLAQGRFEESRAALEQSMAIVSFGVGRSVMVLVEVRLGDVESAGRRFEELLERRKTDYLSSLTLACAALALGRPDLAAELMAAGFEERDTLVPLLPVLGVFAGLRALPGADRLIARIKVGSD